MNIDLKHGVGSLTDFARNTRTRCQEVIKSGKPRILTQNGEASLVVLSVEVFEELAQHAYDHQMDLRLRQALQEYNAGNRGGPAAKVFKRIRSRTSARRRNQKHRPS